MLLYSLYAQKDGTEIRPDTETPTGRDALVRNRGRVRNANEAHMLTVTTLHKAYGDTVAVQDLSFAAEPGQILGMVGPNGAGKTTTLRCIAGIIPPSRGAVSVGGFDIAKQSIEAKQQMAYIPDDPKLFDGLTIWEHFEFIAAAYKMSDGKSRAEEWLARFELTDKRDTVTQELSRGMRQKTAVICGYLHEPSLILFDEPIAGLDPKAIRTLRESMLARAAGGAALIVSSHMLGLVEGLCTHLLILHHGRSLYCGPVADARSLFADLHGDASLEDVFFRATEGPAAEGSTTGARVEGA